MWLHDVSCNPLNKREREERVGEWDSGIVGVKPPSLSPETLGHALWNIRTNQRVPRNNVLIETSMKVAIQARWVKSNVVDWKTWLPMEDTWRCLRCLFNSASMEQCLLCTTVSTRGFRFFGMEGFRYLSSKRGKPWIWQNADPPLQGIRWEYLTAECFVTKKILRTNSRAEKGENQAMSGHVSFVISPVRNAKCEKRITVGPMRQMYVYTSIKCHIPEC